MLHYSHIPHQQKNLVVYLTPGCNVLTVVGECSTEGLAVQQAARLNSEQKAREDAIKREHALCGLYRIGGGVDGRRMD